MDIVMTNEEPRNRTDETPKENEKGPVGKAVEKNQGTVIVSNEASDKLKDESKRKYWKDYGVGKKDKDGDLITSIINGTDNIVVYMVEKVKGKGDAEEKLVWDTTSNKYNVAALPAANAKRLEIRIDTELWRRYRKYARRLVASCLSVALIEDAGKSQAKCNECFKEAEELVDTKIAETTRLLYLLCAFGVTVVVSTVILSIPLFYQVQYLPFIGGAFGVLGSFVSVLQRFRKIKIDEYSTTIYTSVGGITRTLLGFLFGALFVIAYKAGVFGISSSSGVTNEYFTYTFAFISGFSERFIPELIAKAESGSKSKNEGEE
jgi:hypothetical protein